MTEKELQKLFQKKFADREVPYNPEAWTRLEKMLDKAATPWYARQSFMYQSAAIITSIVLSTVVYFNWPDNQPNLIIPETTPLSPSLEEVISNNEPSSSELQGVGSQSATSVEPPMEGQQQNANIHNTSSSVSSGSSLPPHSNQTASGIAHQSENNASPLLTPKPSSSAFATTASGAISSKVGTTNLQLAFREILPTETLSSLTSAPNVSVLSRVEFEENRIEPLVAPKLGLRSDFHWSISGLLGFGSAISNQPNSSSGLASWGIGTEMRWAFHPEFAVSTGFNYSRRNDLALYKKYEGVTYGFGANRQEVEVVANAGDFLEMPLMLNYLTGKGHVIKAGYYAAYLINVRNEVNTRNKGMYDDSWASETRIASGYEDSFNPFDHGWIFGYEWAWDAHWSVGADYLLGLQDLSKDEVYVDTRQHYNRQFRFRISYYLQ